MCRKASDSEPPSRLTYLVFVHLVSRLWIFDVCVVSIEVRGIIIEHVTVGCTLGHVTQTLLSQTTKHLLESLSSSKLELGPAKDFANLNMISSDRRGRRELNGIVKSQYVKWSEWWIARY